MILFLIYGANVQRKSESAKYFNIFYEKYFLMRQKADLELIAMKLKSDRPSFSDL